MIIHSFKVKNFYSFGKEALVDFSVDDNAPDNYGYFESGLDGKLSKVEAVIGPNASGKTNLLKALAFLNWIIVDSFKKQDPDSDIPIKPFKFKKNINNLSKIPTEISVVFEIEENIYSYFIKLNQKRILEEELKKTKFINKRKGTSKIFSRKWNSKEGQYLFEGTNFQVADNFKEMIRKNASVISVAAQANHKESAEIVKAWGKVRFNVWERGLRGDEKNQLEVALTSYNSNEKLRKKAVDILRKFDVALDDLKIEEKEGKNETKFMKVNTLHRVNGNSYSIDLSYESSGTKQLLVILSIILDVLQNGGVAVIDEFEKNLHPEIVNALLELFIDPDINRNKAQLFLSTHSHRLLNELDKYQVILTERDEDCSSRAWRLDQMKGIRSDDNFYNKYVIGSYGAIPDLKI